MKVEMKVTKLNLAASASLFPGLAFRGLAVRERGCRVAFGESPLAAAVGVYQQELEEEPRPR